MPRTSTRRHPAKLVGLAVAILMIVGQPAVHATITGRTGGTADTAAVAASYTSADVGFAEGASLADGDVTERLDRISRYASGTSPIIRVDLDWWHVEPCRGCGLQWDRIDAVVNAAVDRGMRVLVVLAYAPPWANGGHADDKWFPTSDTDWTSIVDRTVRHFTDRVQAYEVWNEPNNEGFGNYSSDRRARYWQLARLAYPVIHAACPACIVLAGASGNGTLTGLETNGNESALWLDWAYANGYGGYFDAVAHHPYPAWNSGKGPSDAECVNRWWNMFGPPGEAPPCGELAYLHSVMVKHGDTAKKIWGTEWGYPTSGAPVATSITGIRDHMVQGVAMWRTLGYTGPLFLYSYRDACVSTGNAECNFGVETQALNPKEPLYTDLSHALANSWPALLSTGRTLRRWAALRSPNGRYELWLQGDGNLVLYRRDGTVRWTTGTSNGVRMVNKSTGDVVLYRVDGVAVWSTSTSGEGSSTLRLHDDGTMVLYRNSDGAPVWTSGTAQ